MVLKEETLIKWNEIVEMFPKAKKLLGGNRND